MTNHILPMIGIKQFIPSALVIMTIVFMPLFASAQELPDYSQDEYTTGRVEQIGETRELNPYVADQVRDITVKLKSGEEIVAQFSDDPNTDADDLRVGEKVVVLATQTLGPETTHIITDKYRLPNIAILVIVFFLAAIAFAGRRGFTAVIGLVISIGILFLYTVPAIVGGAPPLLVATISAVAIAVLSLTVAHGWSKQTGIALVSTLLTLVVSLGLSQIFVYTAKLFGGGTEEAYFLRFTGLGEIDLRGLLLAGIVIGVLGVLDDVTTTQTSAIKNLVKAGVKDVKALYKAGSDIGRSHIVSLVNTLALAYVGASLPLVLMFFVNEGHVPAWTILNGQLLTEEIIRTLVGTTALVLAVPISTLIASWAYIKRPALAEEDKYPHH